ncbi:AEC family transporter [Histidinibacterium aquaticum]|uniref:AEC family transporter n=1 Tax=Histidinibacterium aquaticum TaxID=2613962 RepID=A0A5J5GIU0_9RHOB|nr:AEC family transporter [Histidinibacterium aquaticum]KAA9008037.1 AEC family transporter [Histidinibacterium aquaticum]
MSALLDVVLPVFLVIGFGYLARWRGFVSDDAVDALVYWTQTFALPCLLFRAISTLDLGQSFDWRLLLSFYTGALAGFLAGMLGGRFLFKRSWEDATAFGFCGLFSNSVLLGLPIMERAYGTESLADNYAIIAVHSPFCYGVGITVMEVIRARGGSARDLPRKVLKGMFSNALILGVAAGLFVNLARIPVPQVAADALDLMVRAAIPVAVFSLGGVLFRYRPAGDMRAILYVVSVSLVLHPTIVFGMGRLLDLDRDALRSAVVTAAMAPGVNTYIFANIYGTARRVAASGVLIGTTLAVVTVWIWLSILP